MKTFSHNNSHEHYKRGTIVVDLPSKVDLKSLYETHANALLLNVGAVRLHPEEPFVRAVGRQEATRQQHLTKCYLNDIENRDCVHVYHFVAFIPNRCPNEPEEQVVEFGLSTTAESDKVHLVYAYFAAN